MKTDWNYLKGLLEAMGCRNTLTDLYDSGFDYMHDIDRLFHHMQLLCDARLVEREVHDPKITGPEIFGITMVGKGFSYVKIPLKLTMEGKGFSTNLNNDHLLDFIQTNYSEKSLVAVVKVITNLANSLEHYNIRLGC